MRLTLPYVFELDVMYRHGRKAHQGNFWDLVEVDITEVDDLPEADVFERAPDRINLWDGVPVRFWLAGGAAGQIGQEVLQRRLNRLRDTPEPHNDYGGINLLPAPPYMGSRRMGFVRNAFDPSFSRYETLPLATRHIEQDGREVRWREAQRFYARSLVCCQGNLYARVPEPVWHVRKLNGSAAGYDLKLKPRTNFLTGYREFRLDRINEACEFVCDGLGSQVSETYFPPAWCGAFELRRSDTVELTKSTIAAIDQPLLGDDNLMRLHSGKFDNDHEIKAASDAYTRIEMVIASEPALARTPKMRMIAARWEFELARRPDLVEAQELSTLDLGSLPRS